MGKEHTGTCHSSRVFFAFPGDLGLRESRRLAAVSHPPSKARLRKGGELEGGGTLFARQPKGSPSPK